MAGRRLAAVPEPAPAGRPPDLRVAVADAIAALKLAPEDQAMVALAKRLADEIEDAVDRAGELAALRRDLAGDDGASKRLKALEAMCNRTKVAGWLGPQLQGVLRDLGGAPAARAAMRSDKPVGGRLAQLRGTGPAAAGEDHS